MPIQKILDLIQRIKIGKEPIPVDSVANKLATDCCLDYFVKPKFKEMFWVPTMQIKDWSETSAELMVLVPMYDHIFYGPFIDNTYTSRFASYVTLRPNSLMKQYIIEIDLGPIIRQLFHDRKRIEDIHFESYIENGQYPSPRPCVRAIFGTDKPEKLGRDHWNYQFLSMLSKTNDLKQFALHKIIWTKCTSFPVIETKIREKIIWGQNHPYKNPESKTCAKFTINRIDLRIELKK